MSERLDSAPSLSCSEPSDALSLIPVRMLNAYQYCPRLAYLEWMQGEWADSADTVEGRYQHRHVDRPGGELPPADELNKDDHLHVRSITLSSARLGLIARMDLLETEDGKVVPVDYKRGKRPHVPQGAYDPERVQLCAQALILREQGYECDEAILYFAESKERVRLRIDEDLITLTHTAIAGLRLLAAERRCPPPLDDSPKCPRCSLVGICLPDETQYFRHANTTPRPLVVARDESLPVYIQTQHAKVTKKGETLEITLDGQKIASARLGEVSQLVLVGSIHVTTPCLHALMSREIPVSWLSHGGWFFGHTVGTGHKNVELRTAQYAASFRDQSCLDLAKALVHAKILNARTMLRRNWRGPDKPADLIQTLKRHAGHALRASSLDELLGIEGSAAAQYFAAFSHLLKTTADNELAFDFAGRNRRPPSDPVNALLSYVYALLVRAWTVTLSAVGLDPYRGFYHQPRYGRPALALDMMEPFRPLIGDSCVIQAINNGEISPADFVHAAGSVNLTENGRKRFINTFERRMSLEVTHPLFGYKISYRRLLELESRLLGRYLLGEIPSYVAFKTR